MFIESNYVLWNVEKKPIVSHSKAEAKYRSSVVVASELTWISSLLHDIDGVPRERLFGFRIKMTSCGVLFNLKVHIDSEGEKKRRRFKKSKSH